MAAFSGDRDRIDTGSGWIADRAALQALALSGRHRYISADFPENIRAAPLENRPGDQQPHS
jgi:hypothetical protein